MPPSLHFKNPKMLHENFSGRYGFKILFVCLFHFYEELPAQRNFSFVINTYYLCLLYQIHKLDQDVGLQNFHYYKKQIYDLSLCRVKMRPIFILFF